jgi:predicted enzyme related to lactoylglutathione lyase
MSEKHGYNHGDFGWNELAVNDTQTALAFYQKIFKWKVEEMDMPNGKYYVLINGEDKVGGITEKAPDQEGAPTGWMPYITVDNVDETASLIEQTGGKIVMPPHDIPVPDGPRFTIFQDPAGATLGAISYKTPSE